MKSGNVFLIMLILGAFIQINAQSRVQENVEATIMTTNPDPERFPNISFEEYRRLHPLTKTNSHQELNYVNSNAKDPENFLILVDEFIESELNSVLMTYQQDLANENLSSFLVSVSGNTGEALKAIILDYYNSNNIVGAILVGHLPSIWYEYETQDSLGMPSGSWADFPCDLFYSDLDGVWEDNDSDGVYDEHTGNIHPDIWLGRIKGDNLYISTKSETEMIIDYFNRNHHFRNGMSITPDVGLVYVDDDWQSSGSTYQSAMENVYSNTELVNTSQETNGIDYMDNRLTGNYEFIQVMVHSSPSHHGFKAVDGPDTTWTNVLNTDLVTIKPVANFYNLFACSNARFENDNCMGNMYLLDNYHCLNVIGTTKTGSMRNFATFYAPLSQNKTFGGAFNDWWQDNIDAPEAPYAQVHWYYGNLILGDPTLYVDYPSDPNVCLWTGASSNDWHNAGNWLFNNIPTFDNDVMIPAGSQNSPFIFLNNAQCKKLNIESGATLTLSGYSLDVYNDMQVYGEFNMTSGSSELEVHGNIVWKSGSSAFVTSDLANINVHGSFGFDTGADIQFTYGTVNLIGSSNSGIWSKSSTSYVNNLKILKSSAQVSNGSEFSGDFDINGDLTVGANSTLLNPYSNCGITLEGDLLCYGNYYLNSGTFTFDGSNQLIVSNTGDNFYDLIIKSTDSAFLLNNIVVYNDLRIESGAALTLTGYSIDVYDNMIIDGEFNMSHDDGELTVQGFIEWNSGSTSTIVAELATINVYGNFGFDSGADVQMDNGTIKLYGSLNTWIWSKSSICYVNNLNIVKSNAQVSNGSEFSGDFHINGDLTIGAISTLTNPFPYCDIALNGDLNCLGNLYLDEASIIFEGVSQNVNTTVGDYFNNIEITGSVLLQNDIYINGNLNLDEGELDANNHDIYILGDWIALNSGNSYFIPGSGKVSFNGNADQYCRSEDFNELVLDKPSGELIIPTGFFVSCDSYNWVSGFLTVDGGSFTANDLYHNNIVGSYQLIDGQINLYQDATHYIDFNGNIIIYDGVFNIHGGVTECYFAHTDDAYLYMEGGTLDIKDWGIHIDDGYMFSHVISGGTIKMNGGFSSDRHDFFPTGGYIHLYGTNNGVIDLGWGNQLYNLVINKTVAKNDTKNVEKIDRMLPDVRKRRNTGMAGTRSGYVDLSDSLNVQNNMEITSGQLNLAGHLLRIDGSLAIYGTLKMVNSLDELIIGNDLVWRAGSTSVISAGNIALGRDWFFKDGCTVNIGTGNTVTFTGTQISTISIAEFDNATFGNVILDKTESYTARDSYFSSYTKVTGDLILNSMNEFRSKNTAIDGNLFMDMDSQILIDWGQMDVNGDVDCFGHLNLAGGDFTSYEDFVLQEEGELTIEGGFCSLYKTYTGNYLTFAGMLNLLDGDLEVWDENVRFTTTPNIVNGNIRLGRGLQAIGYGAFQPNSGAVYFIGSQWSNIDMGNGNYFYDLIIQKSEPLRGCIPNDSLLVNNNLTINSGKLQGAGVTVGNALTIGSSGVLDPYNNLVKIGGNWTNSRGATGFVEGSGTVEFFGTTAGSITTSETFNNLELNRDTGNFYYSDLAEGVTVHVENNLTLYNGKFLIGNNATLDVDKDILMFDGTGIRVFEDAVGAQIKLGSDFYDYNLDNENYCSFIPGTSTFTCDGDSIQYLSTNRYGFEFDNLIINKNSTNFTPHTDVTILGDLTILNGTWNNPYQNMYHNFQGNVSICDSGWFDNMGTVVFYGSNDATFERNGANNAFHHVLIYKSDEGRQLSRTDGIFTLLSDLICQNDGNLTINGGTVNASGKNITCTGDLAISQSKLSLNGSSILTMGEYKSLTVYDGGILETLGSSEDNIQIKNENSYAYHMFNIENGGTILAENTIFQNCGYEGLYVKDGAMVGDSGNYEFTNCTFTNGTGGGYLLTIDNSQTLEIENAVFPANTWGCYANVRKYVDLGTVTFVGATGDFSGEYYDEDMYNRINWITGPVLEFSPDYLIFGDVTPGNSVTQYMNIYNSGDIDLEGSITVTEGLTISEMIWKTNSNKNSETHRNVLNFDIPARNMVNYEIVFEPMELMDYSGFITITHNAGADSLVAFLARGTAAKLEANPLLLEPVITENSTSSETLSISNTGNATLEYFAYFEYESATKSTIIDEGFEGTQFPPTGWSVEAVEPSSMNWYDSDFEPHSGAKHAYADMMTIDSRLITSSFTATSNTYLSCWLKSNDFMAKSDAKFGVEVSTDGSNWTMLKQISPSNLALTYQRILLDLSFYNSQTIQLAFRVFDNDAMMAEFYLDDILVSGSTLSENWLSLNGENSLSSQIVAGNPADEIIVGLDTNGLSVGEYAATIWLISNSYINSELSIPVNLTVSPTSIAIPQNLTIEIVGSNIVLNWEAVSRNRAITYKIYSSDDPNAPFETWDFENQVSAPTWNEAIPSSPKFYRVTAVE